MDEILRQVKDIADNVRAKLETVETAQKGVSEDVAKAWKEMKEVSAELSEQIKKISQRQDELESLNQSKTFKNNFESELKKVLNSEKDNLQNFKRATIITKAVGNISTAANLGSYTAVPERASISFQPFRRVHARNIVPVTTTNSPITEYPRHTGGEGGADYAAEGALKPQTDFDFTMQSVTAQTIAHWAKMPTQFLQDHEPLVNFIQTAMLEGYLNKEDAEVFTGTGVGTAIEGLMNAGVAFNVPFNVTNPQRIDVLVAAIAQLLTNSINGGGFVADFIALNPMDFAQLQLTKDTTGTYVLSNFISNNGSSILGVPVVAHNAITAGSFLVGDSMQCQLQIYSPLELQISFEDSDNFVRNLVTIRVESRIKFFAMQPAGFVTDTFSNAITILNT